MPLKRTPPKQTTCSETDTESIEGSSVDIQKKDEQVNINMRRMKRKIQETDFSNFMQEVRDSIDNFTLEQNNKLKCLEESLAEIKLQNTTINTSMQMLSSKYDDLLKELASLKLERKENLEYINTLENKIENIERQSCSTRVEIRNIPKLPNETKRDLCAIVNKIGNVLNQNLTTSDIKDIYRPITKANALKPIVVEFISAITKESLLNNLKKLSQTEKTGKLNTLLIDKHNPSKPIFISEYLTPKGRRLFFLARDFANIQGFKYCWTSYGKIYLRKQEGMPHIRIDHEHDLIKLKEKHVPSE